MLRVTLELVPHGNEAKKTIIGSMEISNTGDHPESTMYGNYAVDYSDDMKTVINAKVNDFFLADGAWELVRMSIGEARKVKLQKGKE